MNLPTDNEIVIGKQTIALLVSVVLLITAAIISLLVWAYKRFITKSEETTKTQIQTNFTLKDLLEEIHDLKRGIEKIPEIQTQISNTCLAIEYIKDQMKDYKQSNYDNSRDIIKLREDLTHVLKEIKIK